jgi:uncharacterized protein (DUF2249 family)
MSDSIVRLDVREDLRDGRHPFERIMEAVGGLRKEQALLLIAPFEPVPLYRMLGRQGFTHASREISADHWEVMFFPAGVSTDASFSREEAQEVACTCGQAVMEVDARGLEPPQPMVVILEAAAGLAPGRELLARTDRRPLHLYAQLEQRGLVGETTPQPDGSFITRIRHRA